MPHDDESRIATPAPHDGCTYPWGTKNRGGGGGEQPGLSRIPRTAASARARSTRPEIALTGRPASWSLSDAEQGAGVLIEDGPAGAGVDLEVVDVIDRADEHVPVFVGEVGS